MAQSTETYARAAMPGLAAGRFALLKPAEWQLALPLAAPYAAFFIVPREPNRRWVANLVILFLLTLTTIVFLLLKRR